ncbi:MAG: hypothetical protein WD941_06055 [Opitutus sp.]
MAPFHSSTPPAAAEAVTPTVWHRGRCRGFTIVEVAMATFVMAFGIASSIIALQTGFKAIDVARDGTLASQIMQSEIERLRLWPWNNTSTGAVDSICELPEEETVSLADMFTASETITDKYTVTRTVTVDDDRPDDVRYITITVAWNSFDGRSHTRSFTTMYSKNGLYDYYYTLAQQS